MYMCCCRNILLGINSNENLHSVKLDLCNTELKEDGAQILEMCLGQNMNITELDISENGMQNSEYTARPRMFPFMIGIY